MKAPARLVTLLAMVAIATPAQANVREAAFASTAGTAQVQTSLFAGAAYRVGFGRDGSPKARAALNVSGMTASGDASQLRFGRGLEIAGGKTGKPALHIAGADVGQLTRASNLSGGEIALITVGVVAIAAAVFVLSGGLECEDEGDPCD